MFSCFFLVDFYDVFGFFLRFSMFPVVVLKGRYQVLGWVWKCLGPLGFSLSQQTCCLFGWLVVVVVLVIVFVVLLPMVFRKTNKSFGFKQDIACNRFT